MDKEHELKLIMAWKEHRDEDAFAELLRSNRKIILSQAKKYINGRAQEEDFMQQGAIGLMSAIERFDPEKNVKLSTFAKWRTLNEVGREGRMNSTAVKVPNNLMTREAGKIFSSWKATRETSSESTEALLERFASENNITRTNLMNIIEAWTVGDHSLDARFSGEDGDVEQKMPDLLVDSENPEMKLISKESGPGMDALLESVFSGLSERERDIISRRKCKDHTLEEIAVDYGISRERVRQIEARAWQRIAVTASGLKDQAREIFSPS